MKPVFESKEYGIGGHNKLEVRVFPGEGVQIWLRDGECNAIVIMDREDMTKFAKVINKVKNEALEEVELYDFTVPVHKRKKVITTSQQVTKKSKRKPKTMTKSFEERKQEKIAEALE